MTLLALRLLLGGWASKVWAFLCHRSFWQLVCMGCAVVIVVQHFELVHVRSEAGRWHKQFDAEHAGRAADRASYVKAQTDAVAKNDAQIVAVKQKQQEISDATVSRLTSRLDLIRGEMRPRSAAPSSNPGSPKTGNASEGPCRASDPAWLCLSPDDRLRAAENEERHDELIDWVLDQSNVKPSQ